MSMSPVDPSGAHTDFSKAMSYGDYLDLDTLLAAQKPLSDSHDEMLFIVMHQTAELWMKLAIHELLAARRLLQGDGDLRPAFKMLARVSRIQTQLIAQWDVLSTMTPADYLSFRDKLGHSSGFQSYQYRTLEYLLGSKDPAMIRPHSHRPDLVDQLTTLLGEPSLYDCCIALLARRGFAIDPSHLERDPASPYQANDSVKAAWITVYRDPTTHWDLYELAEELVDVEDSFQLWRFRHVTTVQRIIGFKTGTGGTAGVGYLKRAVGRPFFPELWDLRTDL
ncbi:MAG: tryptophan 2,3-dioxygenase [Alphaproteobacteria bacterium]|nr:tryptophan 2,3-dioxygenase [Alphaproteobacteria bacterium]